MNSYPMDHTAPSSPFYRLLDTKYDSDREDEGIEIVMAHPELALVRWTGDDDQGKPFIKNSTALHYAANDGKDRLVLELIKAGADVNAADANWYRSVLSWAANNARISTVRLLLEHGADPKSLDALHAAAWGGSGQGEGEEEIYAEALQILVEAGADKNDRRWDNITPLRMALQSGNRGAIEYLKSINAKE